MRSGTRSTFVVVALLVALAALLAPTGAAAITRRQADSIALRTLQPARRGGEVVLFGLRSPVGGAHVISTFGGRLSRARQAPAEEERQAGQVEDDQEQRALAGSGRGDECERPRPVPVGADGV